MGRVGSFARKRKYLAVFVGALLCVPAFVLAQTTLSETTNFLKNLFVVGAVSKGSGSFLIDHPLDPKNWLLYHSFVESPDMKNLYDGIVELDEKGNGTIELPAYFLALNKDFRYLATPIGAPMPNLYLSREAAPSVWGLFGVPAFKISGGVPNGRVSWQVTGIRHDPLAIENPIVVEVEKAGSGLAEPGEYLHPEAYGL